MRARASRRIHEEGHDRQPARQVPRSPRRRAHLRPVRPHQHRGARGAVEEQEDQVRQHPARADRRPRRRRLRARDQEGLGGAVAPLARAHQRGDRRGQRRAGLDPDGGDRRRRADALLRQAPAPGSEPARRRVAVRDLPAVRQARVARGFAAPLPRDPGKGVRARRERPPGPGAGRRADGHLLQGDRQGAVRPHARQQPGAGQAVARRADRREDRQATARRQEAAALRRRRHPARRRGDRTARVRRAPVAAGRAHADGQGRAARRPPADPGHDRFLGNEVHQRPVQGRRLDPGPRHALLRSRLQLVGARVHVQLPADQADPDRHRSGGARPQLSGRDRRGGGSRSRRSRY